MLLIAIGACLGACYIISIKNAENKLKLFGRLLLTIDSVLLEHYIMMFYKYGIPGTCKFHENNFSRIHIHTCI